MKILKKPEVSSSVGLVLGAAGVIVGLAGVLVGIYSEFFKNYQTFVLVISAIIGLPALIVVMGAMWHFIGPLSGKFPASKFTKLFNRFVCYLFWNKYQPFFAKWLEKCCNKNRECEVFLDTLNPLPEDTVKKIKEFFDRQCIKCCHLDYNQSHIDFKREYSPSYKAIILLCTQQLARERLKGRFSEKKYGLSKSQEQSSNKIVVVCNITKPDLSKKDLTLLSNVEVLNCSLEELENCCLPLVLTKLAKE